MLVFNRAYDWQQRLPLLTAGYPEIADYADAVSSRCGDDGKIGLIAERVCPIAVTESVGTLVVDTGYTAQTVRSVLTQADLSKTKTIIVCGVGPFGDRGPGDEEGILSGVSGFTSGCPGWRVVDYDRTGHGWVTLSRAPREDIVLPNQLRRVFNYLYALVVHVYTGMKPAPAAVATARVEICNACPMRTDAGVCSLCGCPVVKKARWASSECPNPVEAGGPRWSVYRNTD